VMRCSPTSRDSVTATTAPFSEGTDASR
jgi:hypothetical protein